MPQEAWEMGVVVSPVMVSQWWVCCGAGCIQHRAAPDLFSQKPLPCSPPATKAWTCTPNTYTHFHPVLCCVGPDQPDPWPPSRCLQLFLPAVRLSRWWALTRMLILSPACGGPLWCFILASHQGVQFLKHWGNDQIIIIIPASEFTVLQTLCFLHSCWVAS